MEEWNVVVVLTAGKFDNGKNATLAFSCGLSALAMGQTPTVFLTSDGATWGYVGSADGISVPGFSPLSELIEQYVEGGGRILLCSVCHLTCGNGNAASHTQLEKLDTVEIGGFASILELISGNGSCITF